MRIAQLRTVVIRRWVTVVLLLLTSLMIIVITLTISGRTYEKVDAVPFREVRVLMDRMADGPMPMSTLLALTMPILLNMLMFLPWGFLMFIILDNGKRSAFQSYLLVIFLAMAFSLAVEARQYFLPTRVADVNDVIWNGAGAMVGAVFGHLRKRVHVAFE